jgi:hypothetical protein
MNLHHLFHTGLVLSIAAAIILIVVELAPLFYFIAWGVLVIGVLFLIIGVVSMITGSR